VHSQQRIRVVRDVYVHADACKIIEVYLVQIRIVSHFQETADRDGVAERERLNVFIALDCDVFCEYTTRERRIRVETARTVASVFARVRNHILELARLKSGWTRAPTAICDEVGVDG
jgi:hypothetical protein